MRSTLVSCCLLLTFLLVSCDGYKILGIFPLEFKSHYIVSTALMKGLAAAGHDVTVISRYSQPKPVKNYREITISDGLTYDSNVTSRHKKGLVETIFSHHKHGRALSNATLMNDQIQLFLRDPREQFDLIIVELFHTDAILGFGQHFNAPIIVFSASGATKPTADLVGTPTPVSHVPNLLLPFTSHMSFVQRVVNTMIMLLSEFQFHLHWPFQSELYERAFPGKNKPDLQVVRKSVSLALLNEHFALSYPRAYVPNMIEIGGIHVNRNDAKELPSDLREFLDSGSDYGIIYFSLGSIVQGTTLPISARDGLLRAFSKLKQKVLWKWEDPNLPGKSDNVLISKWFPQEDVLSHPNMRLIITHGGIFSINEAVYRGIPIIGIPMFYDQGLNMANAVEKGYGLTVSLENLTEISISWALDEMLNNDKYAQNAKLISARYRDQPMTPMETAVYWVEYVARHKGAPHMRSASLDLSFIAYHSLDVWALFAVTVYAFLWSTKTILRCVLRKIFNKTHSLVDKKKQL